MGNFVSAIALRGMEVTTSEPQGLRGTSGHGTNEKELRTASGGGSTAKGGATMIWVTSS